MILEESMMLRQNRSMTHSQNNKSQFIQLSQLSLRGTQLHERGLSTLDQLQPTLHIFTSVKTPYLHPYGKDVKLLNHFRHLFFFADFQTLKSVLSQRTSFPFSDYLTKKNKIISTQTLTYLLKNDSSVHQWVSQQH